VIVIEVSKRAKPDCMELERTLRLIVAEARQAAGCLRYDWYRSPDDDREVFVYAGTGDLNLCSVLTTVCGSTSPDDAAVLEWK
jgi:hypothetical protein